MAASVVNNNPADRRCVLEGRAHDFGRIDDSRRSEIFKLTGHRVETFVSLHLFHFTDNHGAFDARVFSDAPDRFLQCSTNDLYARANVRIVSLMIFQNFGCAQQRHAAAHDDSFLCRSLRRVQRVFDAHLDLFHRRFGRRADFHDSHAAGEFRESLLKLFAIVLRRGFFHLFANGCDATLNGFAVASALDYRGCFLIDDHALCSTEIVERYVFEFDAEVFSNNFSASQDQRGLRESLCDDRQTPALSPRTL